MITFVFPGYSLKNKSWLEETAMSLEGDETIRPLFWEHWTDPDYKFDPEEKANLVAKHTKGDKINIIAKSIGSLVAAHVIKQIPYQINKVIICGIPMNDLIPKDAEIIKKALMSVNPNRLICFQNTYDPHGSYLQVKSFLPKNIKVIPKNRSDHDYPFYDEFNKFLSGAHKLP
jgi:pimeloyl-ACP methyl ester carboxylesterase